MSTQHTPTPWSVFNSNGVVAIMCGNTKGEREVIKWTGFDGSDFPKQAVANAAFIVRAVNSHDALVAALKRAMAYVGEGYQPPDLIEQIDAALTLAGEP